MSLALVILVGSKFEEQERDALQGRRETIFCNKKLFFFKSYKLRTIEVKSKESHSKSRMSHPESRMSHPESRLSHSKTRFSQLESM